MLAPYLIPVGAMRLAADTTRVELRRYLKAEYNADVGWLHAEMDRRRTSMRYRLRAWLRRSLARGRSARVAERPRGGVSGQDRPPTVATGGAGLEAPPNARLSESDETLPACDHPVVHHLGHDADALFYQCVDCGAVLVNQGGRNWTITSAAPRHSSARPHRQIRPAQETVTIENVAGGSGQQSQEVPAVDGGILILGERVDDARESSRRRTP